MGNIIAWNNQKLQIRWRRINAQAKFPLSTSEGQQETGKRPTRERQKS